MVNTLLNVLSYLVLILLAIGVFVLFAWRDARRERAWPIAAESLGLQYTPRDDTPLNEFAGFKILDASGVRSLANVATGSRSNVQVWLADYRYSNRSNITRERHGGFTVCMLKSGRLKVPHFRLHSRSMPRTLTPLYTVKRPEDDPEVPLDGKDKVARKFILETRSADGLRPFLNQGFRERVTAIWKPYFEIEGVGDRLVVTRRSWIAPADLGQLLDQAISILDELSMPKRG
jgi:hypothetical protein